MANLRRIIRPLLISVLCLLLALNCVFVPAVFAEGEDDPVAAVNALLEETDSLRQMQDKRKEFTVSAPYNAEDADNVAEHEAAREGYASYVKEMFGKRAQAQAAYEALTEDQKAQVDPELLAKLTDELDTPLSKEEYPLTPSDNEYNYQILMISSRYYLAYELSMHTTQDKDMPCTLMIADVSGDATSITLDGEYSYGTNNYELTYCCDEREPTTFSAHYKRINLEDCDYYNSYQASKIRAIILNSYPFVSLEEMKASLKESGVERADDLDRADVTAAVQFAVWYYSNRMTNGQLSADTTYGYTADALSYRAGGSRPLITSAHDYRNELWYWYNANNARDWGYDADADERVTSLFNYLIDLPGIEASENQFVVSDIKITRTELVDEGSGMYSIGLNILLNHGTADGDEVTMTVETPSEAKDIDVTGEKQYETTIKAKYGDTVNVTVKGTQHLDKGVYFYEPEGGYEASQSLVGVAEGATRVKAANSFVFARDIEAGLRIYKTEETTGAPLENIVFSVYDVSDADTSETPTEEEIAAYAVESRLSATMTTDSTGYAAASLPHGTYLVAEEPNNNVKRPAEPFYVTLPFEGQDVAELHLVNKEADEPGTVSVDLKAVKDFSDWDKAGSFSFKLEAVTKGAPLPEKTTATATEPEPTAAFNSIVFAEPGTYEYTITEINGGADGVSYDTTPHKVTVTVTEETVPHPEDDYLLESYALKAEVLYDGAESLTVKNTYSPAEAEISVSKLLEGRDWLDTDSFTAVLTAASEGTPMPEKTELQLTKENRKDSFGKITFEKAGTYEYVVKETAGDEEYMEYDSAEHKVTVTVTKADDATNALSAEVEYESGDSAELKNIKDVPPEEPPGEPEDPEVPPEEPPEEPEQDPDVPETADPYEPGRLAFIFVCSLLALIALLKLRRVTG